VTIQEIIEITDHRPWKLPTDKWKYYQEWDKVLFLHYQVDLKELQEFIPNELEIDLFEEKPWVSVVAFTMKNIRFRNFLAFPPISTFHEINIRTYVKSGDKSGVYFLSIEGGKRLSCLIAKEISELPYRFSKISRNAHNYQSINASFNDRLNIDFTVKEEVNDKSQLDIWLTERYSLFQNTKTEINFFELHHLEWPIHQVEIKNLELAYPRFQKLVHNRPSKAQYSEGVRVLSWAKEIL